MKNKLKILFSAVLVTPVLVFGMARADTTTTTPTDHKEKARSQKATTLKERLEARKAEFKTRLGQVQKARIGGRCKAAQGRIKSVQARVQNFDHAANHAAILANLEALTAKLEAAGIDTTEYEAHVAELKTKVEKLQTDFASFKEAMTDMVEMDCAADPDAFKASLEEARELRGMVIQDAIAVRTYLKDEFKPMLKSIRKELVAKKSEGGM